MSRSAEGAKLYTREEVEERVKKSKLKLVHVPVQTQEGERYLYDPGSTLSASQDELKETFLPLNGEILNFVVNGGRKKQ